MKYSEHIEDIIKKEYDKTGDYPSFIELSKKSIKALKKELLTEPNLKGSWFDSFPNNYRGIRLKQLKGGKK